MEHFLSAVMHPAKLFSVSGEGNIIRYLIAPNHVIGEIVFVEWATAYIT